MSTIIKDLGAVTAYADAVAAGYTGTKEEFAQLMASYADTAQTAIEAKEDAEAARDAAISAKDAAEDAVDGFDAAVSQATTQAVQTVQAEGTTQVGNVSAEGSTQVSAVEEKGAEVLESIPADYTQLSQDVTDLKDDLSDTTFNANLFCGWQQGYYASSNGAYEPNHDNYVCTIKPIPFKELDVLVISNIQDANANLLYLNYFDSNMSYVSSRSFSIGQKYYILHTSDENGGYLHISYMKNPTVTPSTATRLIAYLNNELDSNEYMMNALNMNGSLMPKWLNVIYYWDLDGIGPTSIGPVKNRIGILEPIIARTNLVVSVNEGYKYAVFRFSDTTLSPATQISNTGWITSSHGINRGDIFVINMAKSDDSALSPKDGYENLTIQEIPEEAGNGFVMNADLTKNIVKTKKAGTLSYGQSFCIYNDKYYSINGTRLAEQSSDFSVLRDVELSTGHGNALQLGSSNIAYASGWNDQKIYAVNLDTMTIDRVISLPTSGYTTCVVDDLNEIIYIFQRDTYPDTETNYNFIVYDYTNEEIRSNRVINKFGAMQSADLYNGKIVICWGVGSTTLPSGMAVYNTAGDILSEYSLTIFQSSEPEGVCIDRTSKELYISIGTTLYHIYK